MQSLETIREAVFQLPPHDQATLAEEILSTLGDLPSPDDAELARLVRDRAAALDRGETTASDWQEAMARVRSTFAEPEAADAES